MICRELGSAAKVSFGARLRNRSGTIRFGAKYEERIGLNRFCGGSVQADKIKVKLEPRFTSVGRQFLARPLDRGPIKIIVRLPNFKGKMHHSASSENGEEPPSRGLTRALKEFRPAGRGFWANVPDSDWNSWHWQLKHRITTVEQLQR